MQSPLWWDGLGPVACGGSQQHVPLLYSWSVAWFGTHVPPKESLFAPHNMFPMIFLFEIKSLPCRSSLVGVLLTPHFTQIGCAMFTHKSDLEHLTTELSYDLYIVYWCLVHIFISLKIKLFLRDQLWRSIIFSTWLLFLPFKAFTCSFNCLFSSSVFNLVDTRHRSSLIAKFANLMLSSPLRISTSFNFDRSPTFATLFPVTSLI